MSLWVHSAGWARRDISQHLVQPLGCYRGGNWCPGREMVRLAHSCGRNWGGGDSTAEDQLVCLPRAGTISWTWGSVSSRASPASAVWQVFSERVTHPLHAPCWVAGFQPAYEGKVTSSQQSWEIRKEKSNALKNVNSGVSLPVFKITVYILPPSTKDLKQLMSISTNSRALTRH